jgi:CheY-like chemotaxis protein
MASILVVDDDPNNQRMLSYTLRKAGYQVRVASNGQLALDALRQERADFAIIDLAMPVMDGLTFLRQVRADEDMHTLPVIILTASGDDEENHLAMQAGANGFLTKPISSSTILDMVQKMIQG